LAPPGFLIRSIVIACTSFFPPSFSEVSFRPSSSDTIHQVPTLSNEICCFRPFEVRNGKDTDLLPSMSASPRPVLPLPINLKNPVPSAFITLQLWRRGSPLPGYPVKRSPSPIPVTAPYSHRDPRRWRGGAFPHIFHLYCLFCQVLWRRLPPDVRKICLPPFPSPQDVFAVLAFRTISFGLKRLSHAFPAPNLAT